MFKRAIEELVVLADRFDSVGAYAIADVLDETIVLTKSAQPTPQQLAQQQLITNLTNIHAAMLNAVRSFATPSEIPISMRHILDQITQLGLAISLAKQTTASTVHNLVSLADALDAEGRYVQADLADYSSKMIKFAETPDMKPGYKSSLSTRYCPDHNGVQAVRISERVYQCPIDGRKYDYEMGYINYEGQAVAGGSIAAQTPATAPYALPMRLYDSRQNIMNTIN